MKTKPGNAMQEKKPNISSNKINGFCFLEWLPKQRFRNDPVGDVSRCFCENIQDGPYESLSGITEYLEKYEGPSAVKALSDCIGEWKRGIVTVKSVCANIKPAEAKKLSAKILTIALNHLIRSNLINLDPAHDHKYDDDLLSHYDSKGILGLVRARHAGVDEVHISVLLLPKGDADQWIGSGYSHKGTLEYGHVECSCFLERREGKWLQLGKNRSCFHLAVDEFLIDGIRNMKSEKPLGFEADGPFL